MALTFALLCFAAVYLLQDHIYSKYWDKNLTVDLEFQSLECVEGDKNLLKEVITNAKHLPLPILHVKFSTSKSFIFDNEDNSAVTDYYYRNDIFSIKGQQIVTRLLTFTCSKRGCYIMKDASLVSTNLFLNSLLYTNTENNSILYVYPSKLTMAGFEISYEAIIGQYLSKTRLLEDPFEFRGIRNYQPYDNMRSINWKSSARNNQLLVNTYYTTTSREVKILLNIEKHTLITDDEIIESSIRIANTLADRFINDHVPLSIETNACDLFTNTRVSVGAGSGSRHSTAICRSLARIDLTKKPTDFLQLLESVFSAYQGNNTYYILISNNREQDLMGYYNQIKMRKIPSCFIIPDRKSTKHDVFNQDDIFEWEVPINE